METPWAILLCKFNDDNSEPFTRQFYERLFTTAGSGSQNMVDYFRDVSHSNLDLTGSQVFGWLTLNRRRDEYTGSGSNSAGRAELVAWARQAATDAGVSLANFFGVVVCLNVRTDLFGGDGYAVCDLNSMQPSLLGQEMGHGYGLEHSKADGNEAEYQDAWDIMSTANFPLFLTPHSEFSFVGPGMNAWNMRSRGWLDEIRVWRGDAAGFEIRIELRPLVRRDLPGWLAAELPGGYLVELRVQQGWDAAIPRPAVLVHRFAEDSSYIMRSVTGQQDIVAGDVFQAGDGSTALPYIRMDVDSIDAVAQTATLHLHYRPAAQPDLGVFYRGDGDWLVWRAYSQGRWHGEEIFNDQHPYPTKLGAGPFLIGGTESAPAVVEGWRDHRFAVFFRGTDELLHWKAHQGGRWHQDALIEGGGLLSSSLAVIVSGQEELAVFYRTQDDWLAWRSYSEGEWHGEEIFNQNHPYPTRMRSGPAVVSWWQGYRFAVFFRGEDDRLHWKAHYQGRWHQDALVEGGGNLTSDPAVIGFGPDNLGVFYRGDGDWLVWRLYGQGRWYGEEIFNDQHPFPTRMRSAPTVITGWQGYRFAVFFRGDDDRLHWKAHTGDRWHTDALIDGGGTLTSRPGVVRGVFE
jgi:hypothetical protein